MLSFMMMQDPAKAMQLQQQQALAQQMMQDGSVPIDPLRTAAGGVAIPISPWEYAAKAAEKGIGGYMQGKNNAALAQMLSGTPSPQQQQAMVGQATNAAIGNGEGPATAQSVSAQLGAMLQNRQSGGANSVLPSGLDMATAMKISFLPPEMQKIALDKYLMTPEMKLANALHPQGSPQYQQDLQAVQNKNTYIPGENVRQGSVLIDPITSQPKFNNTAVPDNTTPVFGTRPDGTQGTIGATPLPIIPPNTPPAQSSPQNPPQGGPLSAPSAQPPQSGPSSQLQATGSNTLPNGQPDNIDGLVNSVHPSVASGPSSPAANPPMSPAYLPVGPAANAAATNMGKSNADLVNNIRSTAADSPIRQDVYDKIINLSKSGVDTGGGAELYNNIKNYAVNTPILGPIAKELTGNPSDFQEISKFLNQLATRSWQAAGGTGTDAQLSQSIASSPNTKMTPQALQGMAQWGKAGEMALNAKNSFMQNAIGQNNQNIDKANQFENQWKEHFDPKVYQLNLAAGDPAQMKIITTNMTPAQKTILMGKYQYAKQNGWLQ